MYQQFGAPPRLHNPFAPMMNNYYNNYRPPPQWLLSCQLCTCVYSDHIRLGKWSKEVNIPILARVMTFGLQFWSKTQSSTNCSSKCLFFTAVWLFRLSVRFRHANETIFSSGLAGVRYRIGGLELPAHKPLSDFIIEKKYWSNSGQNRKSIRSLVLLRTLTKRKSLLIIIIYSLHEHGYAAYVLSDSYEKPVAQYKICTESHSPLLRADIPVLSPAKHLANVCSVTFHSLVIRINTRRESTTWTLHHRRHLSSTVWCSIDAGHSR